MDSEVPVLAGYLNVPQQSGFSLNRISKKKPCHRYCLLFKASRHGIERLEICESKEDKNPKIITLENCVKITQEPAAANLIQIVKKNEILSLNALSEEELKDWVNALQNVAFRDKSISHLGSHAAIEEDNDLYCSSFGDGLFVVTLIASDTSCRNNIEPKIYMLHLTATELQLKATDDLSIVKASWPYRFIRKYGYREGKFTFEAGRKCSTGEGVFILDHKNPQEVFRCMSAKMKSMKKLISGESAVESGENQLNIAAAMEAGSRSPLPPSPSNQAGVAEFEMNSTNSCMSLRGFLSSNDSLNSFLSSATNPVKQIPNKPPRKFPLPATPSSNVVQQQQTTITSVSVSANNSNNNNNNNSSSSNNALHNSENVKRFQNYEAVGITSVDANKMFGSAVFIKPPSPAEPLTTAHNVSTPPDLPMRNDANKSSSADRDYESIENITDAWKTLGVNDIKHSEHIINNDDNDLIDFLTQQQQQQQQQRTLLQRDKPSNLTKTTKIIDIDIGEGNSNSNSNCYSSSNASDRTYDCLDFLLPNNNTSSGYKTIVNVSTAAQRKQNNSPPCNNDYELIANPNNSNNLNQTQAFRKADDSSLGYGMIRKTSVNSSNTVATTTTTTMEKPSVSAKSALDHRSYNGHNYTIVSKPKRV